MSNPSKANDLCVAAGRRLLSPQTGFIHLCHEDLEGPQHTIPLYENFCFALGLLRTKLVDNVLAAKVLFERLLAFEKEGSFPRYVHRYPLCEDSSRIYPVLQWSLRNFHAVLGERLCALMKSSVARIEEKTTLPISLEPKSPKEWGSALIWWQLEGKIPKSFPWDPLLCTFAGPEHLQRQEGFEPEVTLFDLFMGELFGVYSERALKLQPLHLLASLIHPFSHEAQSFKEESASSFSLFWGDHRMTHSLICPGLVGDVFHFPQELPANEEEPIEFAFYLNAHADHCITVNGKRATTFRLGDALCIQSKGKTLHLSLQGEDHFFGHITKANRPRQIATKGVYPNNLKNREFGKEDPQNFRSERATIAERQGASENGNYEANPTLPKTDSSGCLGINQYEAYDWQIALRTIHRKPKAKLQVLWSQRQYP